MFLLVWWLFQQVQWLYKVSADLHCSQLLTVHFHCSPTQKAEKHKNSIVANLSKLRIVFRSKVASENTQHYTMSLVFLRIEVWGMSAEIPYWWRVTNTIWAVRGGVALILVVWLVSYYKVPSVQRVTSKSIAYIAIPRNKKNNKM